MDELVEGCIQGNFDEVQKILDKTNLDPAKRDNEGWSPLHYASQHGHIEVVSLLLDRGYDPTIRTHDRNTPLHLACANCHAIVARHLLDQHKIVKTLPPNKRGETPLHLACKAGCVEIVKDLVERFPGSAYMSTIKGASPSASSPLTYAVNLRTSATASEACTIANLLIGQTVGNPATKFEDLGTPGLFPSFDAKLSLDFPTKVYLVGDRGCGKSSLIKCLRTVGFYERFLGVSVHVKDVDQHKMGLIPSDFRSRRFGRIMFYDLASGRDCIQNDFIQSRADVVRSVFILMIDFKDEREEMEDKMAFWMSFIYHQCEKHWSPQNRPNVVIVGSFMDVIKPFRLSNPHRLHISFNAVIAANAVLAARFNFLGKFSLDCRKAQSPNLDKLRSALRKKCDAIRLNANDLPSRCYILSSVLERELKELGFPAIQLGDLAARISEKASSPNITLFHLLPHRVEELLPLCKALQERSRILLLKENSTDSSKDVWIIHGLHDIVTKIDNSLQKLINAQDACSTSMWPAIMKRRQLQSCISAIPLSLEIITQLLSFFRIVEALPSGDGSAANSQEFFFPSLIPSPDPKMQSPIEPWESQDSRYSFGFAWSFVPIEDQECRFFLPQFLKLILLHLLINRAHSDFGKYTVWSHGMHCIIQDQLEVYLLQSIDSRAITLNMRCKPAQELACIAFRNQVLKEIRDLNESTQQIRTNELVTPLGGANFPVQQPMGSEKVFNVANLKQNMKENSPNKSSMATLTSLFYLEPYLFIRRLSEEHQTQLIDPKHASMPVTDEFVAAIAKCFGDKWQGIAEQFELPLESDSSTDSSEKLSADSNPMPERPSVQYKDILECLDSISIFEVSGLKKAIEETKYGSERDFAPLLQLSPSLSSSSETPPVSVHLPQTTQMEVSSDQQLSDILSMKTATSTPRSTATPLMGHSRDPTLWKSSSSDESSSDATQSEVASIDSTKEIKAWPLRSKSEVHDVPFLGLIEVLQCDAGGGVYNSKIHGIMVRVPEDAVVQTVNLEFGVTLHGPFVFPKDEKVKAVSPTVWLSVQDNASFSKPIEIVLPHCVGGDCQSLAFYRALGEKKREKYQFRKLKTSEFGIDAFFSGTLRTKLSHNPCFLCIAGKATQDLLRKCNYYLFQAKPKILDEPTWKIHFYVTYLLPTCNEVIHREVGDTHTIERVPFTFTTGNAERLHPNIHIDFERNLRGHWGLIAEGGTRKIEQHQIDFWSVSQKEMKRREEQTYPYPPRFIITVNGRLAETDINARFIFEGTEPVVEQEILLQASSHNNAPVDIAAAADEGDSYISQSPVSQHKKKLSTGSASQQGTLHPPDSIESIISLPAPSSDNPWCTQWQRQRTVSQSGIAVIAPENDVLTRNLVTVINYLDVKSIRPHLRQARVISEQDYLELLKIRDDSRREQAEALIQIVKRKGIEGFHKFLHVLRYTLAENPGHKDIISALETDISKMNVMLAETDIHERTEPIIEQEILCHTSSHCYLRSVDVIGETNFLVTNKAQTFHWEAYGLKLHIPEGALPASLEECKILIKVALSGQFELPQNTSLVSAVYCLDSDPQCNFSKPLTLEMQHCAKPSQMSRLSFARCSQNSLPCTFEILKGGEFTSRSAYGSIQLHSFSLITQLLSRLAMILGEDNVKYRARLYYLMRGVDRREIHFLITKDLDAHATTIQQKYATRDATIGPDLPVEFESDSITLQLPSEEEVLSGGWKIVPLFSPVISKEHVDSYGTGHGIPHCKLTAEWTKQDQLPSRLKHKVTLEGAKKPYTYFLIVIDTPSPGKLDQPQIFQCENVDGTLLEECSLRTVLSSISTLASEWFNLGVMLGLFHSTLKTIEHNNSGDADRCLIEMVNKWLKKTDSSEPSWRGLTSALSSPSVNRIEIANRIATEHPSH